VTGRQSYLFGEFNGKIERGIGRVTFETQFEMKSDEDEIGCLSCDSSMVDPR
jgi:hypothetical protein